MMRSDADLRSCVGDTRAEFHRTRVLPLGSGYSALATGTESAFKREGVRPLTSGEIDKGGSCPPHTSGGA
jgi:hypothetical protein